MSLKNPEVTPIDKRNIKAFETYILQDDVTDLLEGRDMFALGLLSDGKAAGALTGYFTDDITFRISGIYVAKTCRRSRGATILLDELTASLPDDSVINAEFTKEDDDSLGHFFKSSGFIQTEPENVLYKTTMGEIHAALKVFKKHDLEDALYFSEYSPAELKAAATFAQKNDLPVPADGFLSPNIDREASTMIYKNNELKGYLILDRFAGDRITVSGLYSGDNPKVFASLVFCSSSVVHESTKASEIIMIPVLNDQAHALLKHLLPNAVQLTVSYTKY